MKTFTTSLPVIALALAIAGGSLRATAQDKPDVSYIAQTTSKIVLPDGATEADMWKMQQEYYDKVLAKSALLKHFSIYRHAYGSMGASIVTTLEFAVWEDILKFNEEEREALEKAAWPDEAARTAFLKKLNSFEDPYHRDEIYTIRNSMRR